MRIKHRIDQNKIHRKQLRDLSYEQLEARALLSADLASVAPPTLEDSSSVPRNISWFESFNDVARIPLGSLASVDQTLPEGVAGPIEPAVGEWIIQLTDSAASSLRSLSQANLLLNESYGDFKVISGLGTRGSLLVRGQGASSQLIESSLAANKNVQSFSLNQMLQGQATIPNDPEFVAGLMPGMERIAATTAWDVSRGSSSTVVGVVDTGIDPTHPDLYLNIWLNQGELPRQYLDNVGPKLVDIDNDGLITFYDLNNVTRATTAPYSIAVGGFKTGPNASFVVDKNSNGRIDAIDLLEDANWADGRDTDNNGFFDDFFGVNFRTGVSDPFAENNPSDELGHGTHVSGTIGAVGGNSTGVVGVNWQTSLMSLRILDNNNQGDSGAAIRAINYARQMRERYRVDTANRVTEGANVRVLNNSWGQPGGFEASLEAAIQDSSDAGILFVAAAGNGNFLGQGVDNDRTPFFYPASYNVSGVIAVAASDSADRPASFSNYGATSVDLFAPGIGIRSTLPGGGYGSANGTSMATPHVSGTAALVWSAIPEATVAEVQKAILNTVDPTTNGKSYVSTGGRLNVSKAINTDVFAPAARLIAKQNITAKGGTTTEFKIEYSHRSGIDATTIGNDDLIVTRQWGPADQIVATLKPNSITTTTKTATATYIVSAPGGTWDPLDFGDYIISTVAGKVNSKVGNKAIETRDIGLFNVRINDPSVLYVSTFADSLEPGTLRSQIIAANAASPAPRTIILESGKYTIDLPSVVDPGSTFGTSLVSLGIVNPGGWTNATTGDFDIHGNITIVGDINDETVIDAQAIDRVFKVHANSSLTLSRLTIQGGVSPATQGGGGILSIGDLNIDQAILKKNIALALVAPNPNAAVGISGGAVASWNGKTSFNESWITENESDFGGGFYYTGTATATVQRSTFDHNKGGAIYSFSSGNGNVENSTFSANIGGYGAIANGIVGGSFIANRGGTLPSLSADGRYVTFESSADNLVPGDTNGTFFFDDIFVYDRTTKLIERVSVTDDGEQANNESHAPSLSADGRYVTFYSFANNLVPGDTDFMSDIFVYDRITKLNERVSVTDAGEQANGGNSFSPSLSADGRYVTFSSEATNLVPRDTNSESDIFLYDRTTKSIERVSVTEAGEQANGFSSSPSLSADGRYVAFSSDATNLVPEDTNGESDIFLYDRTTKSIKRVSFTDAGEQANGFSSFPSLSADGRYVTFQSNANNLVPGDTNLKDDIFVYDRTSKLIERVSLTDDRVQGNNDSYSPLLSDDGRYVTFGSYASNLVPRDMNGESDIFVYDRTTKLIERVNVTDDGEEANSFSFNSWLSADGRYVTFQANAYNLVPGDTNIKDDIFVYDRTTKLIEPITYRAIKSAIDVESSTIAFTSDLNFDSAIVGDVKVSNSLFAANEGSSDITSRLQPDSSFSNIFSTTPQSSLLSSLQRSGTLLPVHNLIKGNPAINSADVTRNDTRDQLGRIRVLADIGAVEAINATVSGKVYVDANRNGRLDLGTGEQGLPGVVVNITGATDLVVTSQSDNSQTPLVSKSGVLEATELPGGFYKFDAQGNSGWSRFVPALEVIRNQTQAGTADSVSPSLSADGRYVSFQSSADNLVLGDTNANIDIFVYDRTTKLIERVSVTDAGEQATGGDSFSPSLSDDGRYVTFYSAASNLVPADTNGTSDVFVYDRTTKLIERVSVTAAGEQANNASDTSSLSADGRYVAFDSLANNLVPGDTNGESDIFVYDRTMKLIERVNVTNAGEQATGYSLASSLSADGRYVTFGSEASNLVPGDTNGESDIFVYDRTTKLIERVNVTNAGEQATGYSLASSLSADGRYVTFSSNANNLVPGGTNVNGDSYVYDRTTKLIELVNVTDAGEQANNLSNAPSLSADGRYATFSSFATNLVPGDTNGITDVFIYDRTTKLIKRVSVTDSGEQATGGDSLDPSLSADGRYVTFFSEATNLVPGDTKGIFDIFIARNPFIPSGITLNLQAGEVYTDLNIGLVPDPATISGRTFEDTVANRIFDTGEPAIIKAVVFLDLNLNGLLDEGERSVTSAADGTYQFLNTDSYRSYSIVVQAPIGYEQVSPSASDQFAWKIFLPAGGAVTDRDFAFRRIQSTGQSSASAVSGRLFDDLNGNGLYDAGVDIPIANREVYLDATNFGVRDSNEPRVLTDAQGLYSIDGLSSRTVAVATTLDEMLVHVSPLGSDFTLQKYPLFNSLRPFANPQAISSGDFDQDGFLDVAVALGEGNKLSIRLNNQHGGFLSDEIDIDLGKDGAGPTSLVVGQFDNNPKIDVAVVANYSSKVIVLLNYNPTTRSFASQSAVTVGLLPIDIVAGQFGGDAKLDLAVVNQGSNTVASTVQLLTNNGSGVFTAGAAIPTGGKSSVSIVAGNFSGDASLDIAVVHAAPATTNTPNGGVTVLRGNGLGGFTQETAYYEVGALPIDSVTADFNGDGRADVAVANFSSNSISILLGQANGAFRVQSSILGTASGAFDIALGDIDNDGDIDVIASNLKDRNISIFRNIGLDTTTGDVRFEPLENVGLGQFALAQRMPLVVANFDNDSSGPGGKGTLDIVTIPQQTDTLHLLKNKLVNGTHRVALTGTNRISGLDFVIKASVLPPFFNVIPDPTPIVEGSPEQAVQIAGLKKGRSTGPALQFTVTSSNPTLIASPTVSFNEPNNQATIRYTPEINANGTSVITFEAIDAGADQVFGNSDDGIFERSFTATVLAVNTEPTTRVIFDTQYSNTSGPRMLFQKAFLEGEKLILVFANGDSQIEFQSPVPRQNPVRKYDVDGDSNVTPIDVLIVINAIKQLVLVSGSPTLPIFDPTKPTNFTFVDVNGSNTLEPIDVLQVINELRRRPVENKNNNIDLANLGLSGTTIFGAETGDQSGYSVSGAGDVNGDGFEDMIIGARYGDGFINAKLNAGESYLIYGGPSLPATIDLMNLGKAGVTFLGADAGDSSGRSVSGAGDLNGDGFSDLLIGALTADAAGNGKANAGDSYVIFGGDALPGLINLANLATPSGVPGVLIFGGEANDTSGRSVSRAGDVNGDGFDDLIIGADLADGVGNLKNDAGESYVVFGAASLPASIGLATLKTGGITIFGAEAGDRSGLAVSNAGDFNGDGFDDLIIGAFNADASSNAKLSAGESYVVFGGPSLPSTIDLASLGTAGFTIFGADANDGSGRSVSSAGDVNGDGFGDILVGASAADALNNSKLSAGESYLIYGTGSPLTSINLSSLGTAGITIVGAETNDFSGISVSGAGDVNGDGLDDLLIGAFTADAFGNFKAEAGESHVIFGGVSLPSLIDLASFGTNIEVTGFTIYGSGVGDQSGNSVSSAGDVNGDGFDDIVVGAFLGDTQNNLKTSAGESYVIFGSNSFTSSVTHQGTVNAETLTGTPGVNIVNGGRGNDTLIGSGGADFLNGGQGDDLLAVSEVNFKHINGGTGSDTLRLDGSGLTLNLTTVRDNRLLGIETIDITGSGNNTLILDKSEVLNLSDESNTLVVRRNTGDVVTMGIGWVQVADQTISGVVFNVFTQGAATLKVAADAPPLILQSRLALTPTSSFATPPIVPMNTEQTWLASETAATDSVFASIDMDRI